MEKNNLVLLGLLGALGAGAYFYFSNQNKDGLGGAAGGGGAGPGNVFDPGTGTTIYNFTLPPPNFPALEGSGLGSGSDELSYDQFTANTPTKKGAAVQPNIAAILFPSISQTGAYNPSAVQANVEATWPGLTNEQKLAKVNSAPYTTQFKQVAATIYDPKAAQVAAWKTDPLGMKAKLGISSAAGSVPASKKAIIAPATGYQAALITAGTPEQQIEQYSIAPKIYKGKKVM